MSKTTKHFESWWGKTCLGTGCKEIKIISTKTYSDTRVRRGGGADLFWHARRKKSKACSRHQNTLRMMMSRMIRYVGDKENQTTKI